MPPKKAAKPNGFALFAQDLHKQHGRKYASFADACNDAGPLWARMSREQRQPYNDRAKGLRGSSKIYTSEGLDVEELTREQKEKFREEERAREETRNSITIAKQRNTLENEVFFLIHCNIFCYYSQADRYWPAEIGVLSFTLKDGVKPENVYHSMINPGQLPIGYKFDAKQHSDETHLIKLPSDDDEDDQGQIYDNLKAFIEKKKSPNTKHPILFTPKKLVPIIKRILGCWTEAFDSESKDICRVYSLQMMFHYLRNAAAGDEVWTSMTFSERELEKDVYAYTPEIACPFHSCTSKPIFCSKSIVLRYAYTICDNCCSDLNIELIEGQHVPLHSAIPDSTSSYDGSVRGSRSSRNSRRGFDDFDTDSSSDTWETESISSNTSGSTLSSVLDNNFPSLGKSRAQWETPIYGESNSSNSSSVKSYAGATVKSSLPHAFEKMSLNSEGALPNSAKKGYRGRGFDSDSDASSVGFVSSVDSDFPQLGGRGRGFRRNKINPPGGTPSQN